MLNPTGMRLMDAVNLRWCDVDRVERVISFEMRKTRKHNDLIEMSRCIHCLGFNEAQLELVERNTHILAKHKCGVLGVQATPKTNRNGTDNYSWNDWQYWAAGSAEFARWARGALVIVPTSTPGTFHFIAAKRFEKLGWQDREYWFAHSQENGVDLWIPATQEQIATGRKGKDAGPDDLLTVIPVVDPVLIEEITVAARKSVHRFRVVGGIPWSGRARLGMARRGRARCGLVGLGSARRGKSGKSVRSTRAGGIPRQGKARRVRARRGAIWLGRR